LPAVVVDAWTRGGGTNEKIPGLATQQTSTQTKALAPVVQSRRAATARFEIRAVLDSSWLQVHRGSLAGPIVYQGTLEKGQSQLFVGRRLWIDVGPPEGRQGLLNGHVVHLPGGRPNVVVVAPPPG